MFSKQLQLQKHNFPLCHLTSPWLRRGDMDVSAAFKAGMSPRYELHFCILHCWIFSSTLSAPAFMCIDTKHSTSVGIAATARTSWHTFSCRLLFGVALNSFHLPIHSKTSLWSNKDVLVTKITTVWLQECCKVKTNVGAGVVTHLLVFSNNSSALSAPLKKSYKVEQEAMRKRRKKH